MGGQAALGRPEQLPHQAPASGDLAVCNIIFCVHSRRYLISTRPFIDTPLQPLLSPSAPAASPPWPPPPIQAQPPRPPARNTPAPAPTQPSPDSDAPMCGERRGIAREAPVRGLTSAAWSAAPKWARPFRVSTPGACRQSRQRRASHHQPVFPCSLTRERQTARNGAVSLL